MTIRTFKKPDLTGGTLLVGMPHVGIGGTVLTDFILEQLKMDSIACLDSPQFPPFTMIHRGKPRFPVRFHADPKVKIAVLRSELAPLPAWTRDLATKTIEWAESEGIKRIIITDGLEVPAARAHGRTKQQSRLWFVATDPSTRSTALAAGIREFDQGVLGGIVATLLLEARVRGIDVVALLAEFHDAIGDAQAAYALAKALPALVPGLTLDLADLEGALTDIERVVRAMQDEAEQVATHLPKEARIPMMYG